MEMLEDRRRDCNENGEEIKQLHERVKYNYDRLDALNDIPLRVKHFHFFFSIAYQQSNVCKRGLGEWVRGWENS